MEEIICQVIKIIYRDPENNYSVIQIKLPNRNTHIAQGVIEFINFGAKLKLYGNWIRHKRYGNEFAFKNWQEILPLDIKNIQKYLISTIKGIGTVNAKRLAKEFGATIFDIFDNLLEDSETENHIQALSKLENIKGIGKKLITNIEHSWREQSTLKEIVIFLQSHNISGAFASKIFQVYGKDSLSVIKQNPYKLIEDIRGIGFKTADELALKMGISETSFLRLQNGIIYSMKQLAKEGHCFAQENQLIDMIVKQLTLNIKSNDLSFDETNLYMMFDSLTSNFDISPIMKKNSFLIGEGYSLDKGYSRIYLPYLYYSEVGVSRLIKKILKTPCIKEKTDYKLNPDVIYNDSQKEAIITALSSKFMILTGGPGTGKTTVTKGILNLFLKNNFKVLLAAPTGRAAKRLSEATGSIAKTIHQLLGYHDYTFNKNSKNKLDCDVIIVDECSMIDISLMYHLLEAVPYETIVILVGDKDQLPSVDAGNVFRDIIESGVVKIIELKKIYRQEKDSNIIKNAELVNKGIMPELTTDVNSDFVFIDSTKCKNIPLYTSSLYTEKLAQKYNINPLTDIQILCPMKKGNSGTIYINSLVQYKLHKKQKDLPQICKNVFIFSLHDKVMQTHNDYDKNVFNGDIGEIIAIDLDNSEILIDFYGNKIVYNYNDLDNLVLAYAISIHKSQGGEFPFVILVLEKVYYKMMEKTLLYTAITRAKKKLILIGDRNSILYCVTHNTVLKRNTMLKARLLRDERN